MNQKTVLVEVTAEFKIDPKRPRPKWWDKYIGEKFRCYQTEAGWCWKLSRAGLRKLERLKGGKSFGAIIHTDCGKEVAR